LAIFFTVAKIGGMGEVKLFLETSRSFFSVDIVDAGERIAVMGTVTMYLGFVDGLIKLIDSLAENKFVLRRLQYL
jgi:hypothetical protein